MKIGIDLGGTKTEGILLDDSGREIKRLRYPTPVQKGYAAIVEVIRNIVWQLDAVVGTNCTVGIGTPGSIDKATGLLRYSNTTCLNGKPIQVHLQKLLKRPVRVANDANCFTLSESLDGAAQGANVVFGVIIGTGTGGGIVVDGKILAGANGMGGEWGHNVLDANGDLCFCGQRGCVETFLSGPALLSAYQRLSGQSLDKVESLLALVDRDDAEAVKVMENYYDYFAQALSYIVKIIDPDVIVLGGGLSNIAAIYHEVPERLQKYFSDTMKIRFVRNQHGDSSGVRGAANLF